MRNLFQQETDEKLHRSIEGSLSLMPIADLIQWIEGSKKSGTLVAVNEQCVRRFFFQNGTLIFVWCDQDEQVLLQSIEQQFHLMPECVAATLEKANHLGISFVGLLSSEEGIPLEQLSDLIAGFAEKSLTQTLSWKTGRFRFNDQLPPSVVSSPITIKPTRVLLESTVQFDEEQLDDTSDTDPVLNEIYDQIRRGAIDIPPLPADMQLLMDKINDPNLTIDQVTECLTDPLLVSKVLRICNSPFYGRRNKVDTLRDAVVYMGLKSLMSIVTVNALSGFSPIYAEQIEKILHHSMMVGMIAKQLCKDMGGNHDQAFVCGLLHDLGRIIMLEMLSKYNLKEENRQKLIREHHETLGALVAKRWNFSEEVQEVVRYHHTPDQAHNFHQLVQIIYMADMLAKNELPDAEHTAVSSDRLPADWSTAFTDHLEELDQEIAQILSN